MCTSWQCNQNGKVIESSFWPQQATGEETDNSRVFKLFEQGCYSTLYDLCLSHFPRNGESRVIPRKGGSVVFLYGVPGIGKSCFLDYALMRLIDDGYTVLYLHGQRERAYVFRPPAAGGVEPHPTMETLELSQALWDGVARDVDLILLDPNEESVETNRIEKTHLCGKPTIVGLSPDEDNCKKLRKDLPFADLYMGTLDSTQAEEMRAACFPLITKPVMEKRFKVVGGIPRYLFKELIDGDIRDAELAKVTRKQTSALNIMIQNPLVIDAGEVPKDYKSLWTVFHMQPQIDASNVVNHYEFTIEPCCDDFRSRIRDHLMQLEVSKLWRTYSCTMERHGTLRGIRYEAYAHKKIHTNGLSGKAASLMGGSARSINVKIPARVQLISLPSNDLQQPLQDAIQRARLTANGAYILPETSNFPVVDSLYQASGRRAKQYNLRMKAGCSKPLAANAAQHIFRATQAPLLFVVPDESLMQQMLGFTGGQGPQGMRQYRIVLAGP